MDGTVAKTGRHPTPDCRICAGCALTAETFRVGADHVARNAGAPATARDVGAVH
jgi:hypothetical protein